MTFMGPGIALGQTAPISWQAQEIRYYKLSMANNGSGLRFKFLAGSGLRAGSDISGFIAEVLAGNPTVAPFPDTQTPPDLIVTKPCYVVVELDDALNWHFLPNAPALTTKDNHAADYCALMEVDSSGGSTAGHAPPSPPCRVIYFSVVSPKPAQQNVDDPFNYYVQFAQGPGQTVGLIIDPAIKNRGGTG